MVPGTAVVDPSGPSRIRIWGIWTPGRRFGPFIVFLKPFLSSFCVVSVHIVLLRVGGGLLPLESAVAMGVCSSSTVVFGWVVCVKWRPRECQDLKFNCKALHCNDTINSYM